MTTRHRKLVTPAGLRPYFPDPFVYNFTPGSGGNMAAFRAGTNRVKSGTGVCRVVIVGDSVGLGQFEGGGATHTDGAFVVSWPYKMASYLSAAGLPACCPARLSGYTAGDYGINTAALVSSYDPRWTVNGAWLPEYPGGHPEAVSAPGGPVMVNTTLGQLISFTPGGDFDRVRYQYVTYSGGGTLASSVNAGGFTNQSTNASNGIAWSSPITISPGDTVNVKIASGSACYFQGFTAYCSTLNRVEVFNTSFGAANSIWWARNTYPWQPGNAIDDLSPDLTIICLRLNDDGRTPVGVTGTSTFQTNLQTIVTNAKLNGGSVLLMSGNDATTLGSYAQSLSYRDVIKTVADANNCVFIDDFVKYGTYAVRNANGWMSDDIHPSSIFYDMLGRDLARVLMAA